MTTNQKIKFLRKEGTKVFKKLRNKYPGRIVGFRIDKKMSQGILKRNYSIVFHVVKKIEEKKLNTDEIIPKTVKIRFPDQKIRVIKTDVDQTGKFKLHSGIGGIVRSSLSPANDFGTAGLFVTDDGSRTLMITNYHVAAAKLINQGINSYRRNPSNNTINIRLRVTTGTLVSGMLEEGIIAKDIDVAFILLPTIVPSSKLNAIRPGLRVEGRVTANPIPESFKNRRVNIFSSHNPTGISTKIVSVSTSAGEGSSHYEDLIAMDLATVGGDSGSIVLINDTVALGIIFAADQRFSYAIPFYKIENFKNFQIL